MARIKNVELPKTKALFVGLTAIHGIGQSTGKKICEAAGLNPEMKVQDLTLDQEALIRTEVDKYLVEGDLRREVQMSIKRLMDLGSYVGLRHRRGLPCHGQRTKTNARTRKGPKRGPIAGKKKATKK